MINNSNRVQLFHTWVNAILCVVVCRTETQYGLKLFLDRQNKHTCICVLDASIHNVHAFDCHQWNGVVYFFFLCVIGIELRLITEFNVALVLVDIWSVPKKKKKARQVATCHFIHNICCLVSLCLLCRLIEAHRIEFVAHSMFNSCANFFFSFSFWGQANRWFLCAYINTHTHSISARFLSNPLKLVVRVLHIESPKNMICSHI